MEPRINKAIIVAGSWMYEQAGIATKAGYIERYEDIQVDKPIRREEAAAMIAKPLGLRT